MRIGMMADTYKPYVSGVTNYIDLNKRYLEKSGHEVYVFTFSEPDHEDDDERVIRSPGLPLADTGFFLSLKYSREAKKLAPKHGRGARPPSFPERKVGFALLPTLQRIPDHLHQPHTL